MPLVILENARAVAGKARKSDTSQSPIADKSSRKSSAMDVKGKMDSRGSLPSNSPPHVPLPIIPDAGTAEVTPEGE